MLYRLSYLGTGNFYQQTGVRVKPPIFSIFSESPEPPVASPARRGYNSPMPRTLLALALALAAPAALAWTPASQRRIAEQAARLAPPDLYRQLARNRASYLQGATDPFKDGQPEHHFENGDGAGRLDEVIAQAVKNAVAAIRDHRPFHEIAWRAGVVSHYLADANNPLNSAASDPQEERYFADFLRYLESAEPRIRMVFYGFRSGLDRPGLNGSVSPALPLLIGETLARSRGFYPLVGREYRRVGFASGRQAFDDRSTAYAVAALAHSHAVSDIAEVLRYIWLAAGGIDSRDRIPERGLHVLHLPRTRPGAESP